MKSQIRISRSALIHNIQTIRHVLPERTKIMAVVKANAYGHGLELVAKTLEPYTDAFAVYHFETAQELLDYTNKPILILGGVMGLGEAIFAVQENLECAVYQAEQFSLLQEASRTVGKPARIHFSTTTGLNREGLSFKAFRELFATAMNQPDFFVIKGVYSHFANIEDTSDPSYAKAQIEIFREKFVDYASRYVRADTIDFHLSSTAGVMVYEQHHSGHAWHHQMVRPGLDLYGLYPSKQLELEYRPKGFVLRPVLTLSSHVRNVFDIKAGESVGYGLTYTATRDTRCATIPLGYSDGIFRKFSNVGKVLINGEFCPVIGRQAMNITVFDVSHLPNVQIGDEVVFIGSQGDRRISAEYLADLFGTINYEIVTALDRSLPRILVD